MGASKTVLAQKNLIATPFFAVFKLYNSHLAVDFDG
jgi:hypothetical protein